MPSRQDQVQAYRFAQRRLTYAVLSSEPETADLPLRRTTIGIVGGALLALILLAGWAVAGLTGSATPDWRDGHALIIDRQTGARYVYRDGALHPVVNYASARLILDSPSIATRWVRSDVLNRQQHGATLGIVGAPDGVPDPSDLVGLPSSVCGGPVDGTLTDWAVLGSPVPGGHVSTDGILVTNAGTGYLIWHNERFALPPGRAALVALSWDSVPPIAVPASVLNQFPKEHDLAPSSIPDVGHQVTLGGKSLHIGEVLVVQQSSPDTYYLVLPDGVAKIGQTTLRLLAAMGTLSALYGDQQLVPTPEPLAYFNDAPLSGTVLLPPDLPDALPKLDNGSGRAFLCARYTTGDSGQAKLSAVLFDAPPSGSQGQPPAGNDDGIVGRTTIRAGGGALLRTIEDQQLYLVTDQGIRFTVADRNAQVALGLGDVQPLMVPSALAGVLPRGPDLAVSAALAHVTAAPSTPSSSATQTRPG